jgi:hypothetical protein
MIQMTNGKKGREMKMTERGSGMMKDNDRWQVVDSVRDGGRG